MVESTVTVKGQTTVPLKIRESIGATSGTRLVWHPMPDGSVLVRAKNKSILDMAGMLKPPRKKRVLVEDMNPWR